MKTDPGFYQVARVLIDFRRMALKQAVVVDLWCQHHNGFDGTLRAGPFSKLLEIFEPLGWRVVSPPLVCTHLGTEIDLLEIPEPQLMVLLEDAWTDWISTELQSRSDFSGLNKINLAVLRRAHKQVHGLQFAQVAALQEGAFCTGAQQAKFDNMKTPNCPYCQVPDDLDHRCMECRMLTEVHQRHESIRSQWGHLTKAQRHRLMPEKFPKWEAYQQALGPLACPHFDYEVVETTSEWVDLFVDGSCLLPDLPECSLSSWALVSATHERTLSSGIVPGFHHSSDRAELVAMLSALTWAVEWGGAVACWTDSAYTATGVWRLLDHIHDPPFDSNTDLWIHCAELLSQLKGTFRCHHIPGHVQEDSCENPVQGWLAHWNHLADRAAWAAHSMYSWSVRALWEQLVAHQRSELKKLIALQQLHAEVASTWHELKNKHEALTREMEAQEELAPVTLQTVELESDIFLDSFPNNWLMIVQTTDLATNFGSFGFQLMQHLLDEGAGQATQCIVSWLELSFWCHRWFAGVFPAPGARKGQWMPATSSGGCFRSAQTLAAVVRLVRSCVRAYSVYFGFETLDVRGINLGRLGVGPPQGGLALRCSDQVRLRGLEDLRWFCLSRPIRTCNDLVRPLSVRDYPNMG